MKKVTVQFARALSLFLIFGCATSADASSVVYLKNNIHAEDKSKGEGKALYHASYANFTKPPAWHVIIPVNTPVTVKDPRRREGKEILLTTHDGKDIRIEFNSKRMRMANEDYVELITSPNKISLEGLSEIDRQGIAEGKPYVGMTKEGIRIALGYPAVHRTPSLDACMWVYWTDRWTTMAIEFDADGHVKRIWW
jgi:hypothetical protein